LPTLFQDGRMHLAFSRLFLFYIFPRKPLQEYQYWQFVTATYGDTKLNPLFICSQIPVVSSDQFA